MPLHIKDYPTPKPTTDVLIEYNDGRKEGLVLITRKFEPYGIAIPGGIAEVGITLEENAIKEAKEETGLDVILDEPERPLCVHSHPNRDPRYHMISNAYTAKGTGKLKAGDDAKTATLYTISEVKDLLENEKFAFEDHKKILTKYLEYRGLK